MNKYYIAVDCEGVACAVGVPGKGLSDGKNYEFACLQATREANAAAKALFDSGAQEVFVWDAHGTGVNLHYDLLDERCKIVMGSGHKGRFVGIDASFTAVLFIGYHAKENTARATLAHTFCSTAFQFYKINGAEVGELAIDAAFAGSYGVPVLFCASDDCCVSEAKSLFEGVTTVVTKEALSWTSAISKQPMRVCNEIYENVVDAVSRQNKLRPYCIQGCIKVEIRYKRMDDAAKASLYDMDGNPFVLNDSFTRSGTVRSIKDLF
ncbi:MAG: M55 family metallopeptidase [Oscillospiraceae bacterium]